MFEMFIFIVKETVLSMFHLGSFLDFLDSWKMESNSPYLCIWEFNDGFSLSAWTFFSLSSLSKVLLMHVMITEMAVFNSFQIMTIASGLVSEIIGLLHLCLSWLIFLFSKLELKMSCSAVQNIVSI